MPECLDCGNQEAFVHFGHATETRIYDDSGDYLETVDSEFETRELWCKDCDSRRVRRD